MAPRSLWRATTKPKIGQAALTSGCASCRICDCCLASPRTWRPSLQQHVHRVLRTSFRANSTRAAAPKLMAVSTEQHTNNGSSAQLNQAFVNMLGIEVYRMCASTAGVELCLHFSRCLYGVYSYKFYFHSYFILGEGKGHFFSIQRPKKILQKFGTEFFCILQPPSSCFRNWNLKFKHEVGVKFIWNKC